jgi:hypothetical protein
MNPPRKWPDLLRRYGLALAWSSLALLIIDSRLRRLTP